jgi:hypothetical protein
MNTGAWDSDRLILLKARYDPADMIRASPVIPRAGETTAERAGHSRMPFDSLRRHM